MSNELKEKYAELLILYDKNFDSIELFHKTVRYFFEARSLKGVVHSIRHRLKDTDHLLEKIDRKNSEDHEKPEEERIGEINKDNLFERITDIAGVRVLHLYLTQFEKIHRAIMQKVEEGDFVLFEDPKAYTWDPDSIKFFNSLDINTEQKDSFYTSIHYVLKPNTKSKITCEIQVRTLLEEVWGEVDHTMNYPTAITDEQCREQIRVLARLVSAGSHLADSIMKRYGKLP
ncbi:RelA/SpoT domain-containing protein [Desulfotignum phosphitoxidans]|jgi:ppGpp synthetase/RelA/SpoT-type nucleotidyltranferase|uniref:RelA/SpoT family proetin n=1 Tax=Desulfotignum phosphitoxidans DSM 13687 TaxID=1286635 RepID=S0G619_9BACT|nr:RelA/SpoT domain-containing protein [Desulfotignum phosphitoxidans]EMS79786.1 RelA/SpoT family proetin [Desulfotignum phosphitoxidans DSM 13687]